MQHWLKDLVRLVKLKFAFQDIVYVWLGMLHPIKRIAFKSSYINIAQWVDPAYFNFEKACSQTQCAPITDAIPAANFFSFGTQHHVGIEKVQQVFFLCA